MSSNGRPDPIALLGRVSSEEQAQRETVQAQIDYLKRWADLNDLPVAGVFVDDGVSGTVPLGDRPDGRRLLDLAEAGAFKTVVVMRLDRLARSLRVLMLAHDQLRDLGVAIRSATEPFDTSTPFGRAMFQFLGIIAELEKSTFSERTTHGRDRKARLGQYTGGPIPFGYDLDAERCYTPSLRVVDGLGITEAELVRDIFSRIAYEGATLCGEQQRLTALGLVSEKRYGPARRRSTAKSGEPKLAAWSPQTLQKIVRSTMYRGVKTLKSSVGPVERPYPPIVDDATWNAAQSALTKNRNLAKKNAKHDYLLRGLVTCGHCGFSYVGNLKNQRHGEPKVYYRCSQDRARIAKSGERCMGGTILGDTLEGVVWREIRYFVEHPDEYVKAAQDALRQQLADASADSERRRQLTKDLAATEQQRERVLDLYRRGRITVDDCDRQLDKAASEARTLRELLDALKTRAEMASATEAYIADVGAALVLLRDEANAIERAGDRKLQRALIELLVPSIVLRTEVVTIATQKSRKRMTADVRLAFQPAGDVVSLTRTRTRYYSPRSDAAIDVVRVVSLRPETSASA